MYHATADFAHRRMTHQSLGVGGYGFWGPRPCPCGSTILIFSKFCIELAKSEMKRLGSKAILLRSHIVNKDSKTNQQLVLEIEELRARLDVAQKRLQEADERMQAEMTEFKGVEQALEERLRFDFDAHGNAVSWRSFALTRSPNWSAWPRR
jgi:hypothetical protein